MGGHARQDEDYLYVSLCQHVIHIGVVFLGLPDPGHFLGPVLNEVTGRYQVEDLTHKGEIAMERDGAAADHTRFDTSRFSHCAYPFSFVCL